MKKILALMMALVMLCGLSLTALADDAKFDISVDTKTVKAGEDVTVTVKLNETISADKGGTALQGTITYNPDEFTYKSTVKGEKYGFLTTGQKRATFSYFNPDSIAQTFPAGTVVTVTFTAIKDMEINHLTSEFKLTVGVADPTGKKIVSETDTASIIISKDHTWDDGKITTNPTCYKEGVKTFTCKYEGCSETKTEPVPATGEHVYDNGKVTTEPTCKDAGVLTKTCTTKGCDATTTEAVPATGNHVYDNGKVTTEPTCKDEGVLTKTCTTKGCEATITEAIPVDEDAHVWDEGKVTKEATCTEDGEKTTTCTICGKTETEVIPAAHTWDEGTVTKEATCTEPGEKTYACTVEGCEETKAEEIPALGHKGGEATTDKKAVCEVCGEEYGELLPEESVTPEKPEGTDKPNDSTSPDTGDDSMIMVCVATMILATGAAIVIRKRKMA